MLLEAIESVFAQTLLPDEVIIVDCGSKNGTKDAVLGYSQKVIFLETKIPGASSQRNTGISKAKNDFIPFLDDDDIWHPEKLKIQMQFLKTNPENAMASSGNVRIRCEIKFDRPKWICGDLYKTFYEKFYFHTNGNNQKRCFWQS